RDAIRLFLVIGLLANDMREKLSRAGTRNRFPQHTLDRDIFSGLHLKKFSSQFVEDCRFDGAEIVVGIGLARTAEPGCSRRFADGWVQTLQRPEVRERAHGSTGGAIDEVRPLSEFRCPSTKLQIRLDDSGKTRFDSKFRLLGCSVIEVGQGKNVI